MTCSALLRSSRYAVTGTAVGDALGCVTALCAGDVVGAPVATEAVPGALHAAIAKATSTPTARAELWIHIWTIPPPDRGPWERVPLRIVPVHRHRDRPRSPFTLSRRGGAFMQCPVQP